MLVNNFLDWKSRTNLPDWMNDDYLIICYQLDAAFEGFSSLVFQFLIPSLPSSDPKKFHFIGKKDLTLACLRTYPFDLIIELFTMMRSEMKTFALGGSGFIQSDVINKSMFPKIDLVTSFLLSQKNIYIYIYIYIYIMQQSQCMNILIQMKMKMMPLYFLMSINMIQMKRNSTPQTVKEKMDYMGQHQDL